MACLQFEQLGLGRVAVPTVSYVDHNVLQFDDKNPDDHAYLRSRAARYGALYSRPGNGIAHYLHLERFSRPGQVLLGADSDTTMAGALGMLAIGAGATEVAVAMAGRPYPVERPRDDLQHGDGDRRDHWDLPERRADAPLARVPGPRGPVRRAGRGRGRGVRRDGDARARRARAADRAALVARQRRARARGGGGAD